MRIRGCWALSGHGIRGSERGLRPWDRPSGLDRRNWEGWREGKASGMEHMTAPRREKREVTAGARLVLARRGRCPSERLRHTPPLGVRAPVRPSTPEPRLGRRSEVRAGGDADRAPQALPGMGSRFGSTRTARRVLYPNPGGLSPGRHRTEWGHLLTDERPGAPVLAETLSQR